MKPLSDNELNLIIEFLNVAKKALSNCGCNDYTLPVTDDNIKLMNEINNWNDPTEPAARLSDKYINTYDWLVAAFLVKRVKDQLKG